MVSLFPSAIVTWHVPAWTYPDDNTQCGPVKTPIEKRLARDVTWGLRGGRQVMAVSVNPITDKIIGSDKTPAHCEPVTLLGLNVINEATYLPRVPANTPFFYYQPSLNGRLGVFAVTTGSITRSWILLLPETGTPDRVMIGILPSIGQAADYYSQRDGGNPVSVPLIRDFVALVNGMDPYTNDMRDGKVQACYGSQVLGSSRPMALLIPVRTLGGGGGADPELGPFVSDGQVIADTINGIASATGGAFKANAIEAFTHSNGIVSFNTFLQAIYGRFIIRTAIALDPAGAQSVSNTVASTLCQHLSGQTGGIVNGRPVGNFEFWPFDRWKNEPDRDHTMRMFHNDVFDYLHNYAFPRYLLRFSIQVTTG